jgi:2'-5' RNA ligase
MKLKPHTAISKYFIAIVPPSPVYEKANKWKEYFSSEFNSHGALRSPPHITLHMPFEWKTSKEESLKASLKKFTFGIDPFEIKLSNFGCFEPRVIFIQVVENNLLKEMQSSLFKFCKMDLNLFNANRQDKPFHPHLTVAFRDLKKEEFYRAWEKVKGEPFSASFPVQEITLLKQNGKLWEVFEKCPIGKLK